MKTSAKIGVGVALIASFFVTAAAHADAESARRAFYTELHQAGVDVRQDAQTTVARETVVNGVYKVVNPRTKELMAFVTENGKLFGDGSGWRHTSSSKPISDEDRFVLRAEMLRNISPERTVKIQYGNGGGRRLILMSSLDCPYCAKMEANLAKVAGNLNTTFYLIPALLNSRDDSVLPQWGNVARIWCSQDSAEAWKTYWTSRRVPTTQKCGMTGFDAREANRDFDDLMSSVGIKTSGSPKVIREDGRTFTPPPTMSASDAEELYGPTGLKAIADVYKVKNPPSFFLGGRSF